MPTQYPPPHPCPARPGPGTALILVPVLVLLLVPGGARAASRFWDGSSNGNLSVGANWVGGVAPVAGDDLVFQAGVSRLLVTNDFSPNRAFNTLLFQGSNYFVRGNAILVTNGISSINPVGPNHVDADVEVRASQPWEAQGPLAALDFNGNINLNANTLTVRANTGDFSFSGVISGTGSLVKTNVGTLRLDGAGHNSYTGLTRFDGGVLELAKFALLPALTNFTAIPGDLTVGDGNGLVGTDVLRLLADEQIADTSDVTVKNSALLDLNGRSDRIASLTLQGGRIETGAGLLTLGGNVSTLSDSNVAVINGRLSLGGATRTFAISTGLASPDLQVNAEISAGTSSPLFTAGIIKNGGGSLTFAATNTYNGVTTINDGQLAISADGALGATTSLLGGAVGTVINGDANLFLAGVQVTNESLTLNSTNPSGAFTVSGACVWTGNISLTTNTFLGGSGALLLSGTISGAGGFTKIGSGSVTLAGTNANSYTGTTAVRDGTLLLGKDTTAVLDGAMSGPLVIGEDELPENSDVVRYLHCCQLPDSTDVTINASGLLDLNGFGENLRNLIFNGGDLDAPSPGSILPVGDITVNANTNSIARISGRMSVLSNPTIAVTGHFFSPDLRIDAQLTGAGGLTKTGPGELSLTASNSYTGLTTVEDGLLEVDDSFALGSTAGGTVVRSGGVLALRFDVHVPAEPLTLAGTGQSGFGALSASFGSNSWAGDVTLSGNATLYVDVGDFLNVSGAIAGGFDLTKSGTGTLIFSGGTANSFSNLFANGGTLVLDKSIANAAGPADLTIGDGSGVDIVRLGRANQIADGAALHLSTSGRFELRDQAETTGAIDGRGVIDLGSGTLRAGADNGSSLFSGLILGTGDLFKLGAGTWTLGGNNTYSGQTTVSAGTLVVNGSQPQSALTVNGTATLMGAGTVGSLQIFGSLRPGRSPGLLTCSNLNFAAQGDYFVELNGPVPGAGYDQLNVRGTNQLGGAALHVSVGFAPAEGQQFVIINNDGSEAIIGTFAGLPAGAILTANNLQFQIRYSTIFENDVVLTLTNTAARLLGAVITGGNGDGNIDINECNFLQVAITNVTGGTLTAVTGTLVPKTAGVSVTSGYSAYPAMAAGARATNTTPFQFSTGPGFVCGTNVAFDLVLQTPANGAFSIPLTLPSGSAGPALRFNNNNVTTIPDNGFVDLPINVAGVSGPLKRVAVTLHITHPADSDLDISLIGPDGTTVNLSSDNGGTASDYGTDCADDRTRTTFNDSALTNIVAASAPFVGTFRPEESLSAFQEKVGGEVNGVWRLRVVDDTPGAIGSVRCWSLLLSPTMCNDAGGGCESCPEDRTLRGTLGVGSPSQDGHLIHDGNASACGSAKACPGLTGAGTPRHYDAYTFENGESNACVTVTLTAECDLFSATYLDHYNPADPCQNYLADAGSAVPGGAKSYSFNVAAKTRFVVVVSETNPAAGCGYVLNVDGGSCRPWLHITPGSGNRVSIDWSTAAIGYHLEHTNALGGPPQPLWVPVPAAPSLSGGRFRVSDPIALPPTNNFYRLRRP